MTRRAQPPPNYGGQAVVEGVLIRGAYAAAVVVRGPDGALLTRTEIIGGAFVRPLRRVPLVRGLAILGETLAVGVRALTWSSLVARGEVDQRGDGAPIGRGGWAAIIATFSVAATVFLVGPALAASWMAGRLPWFIQGALEGSLRLGLLVGYIWRVGRSPQVQRVFQYHGAEHMAIQAHELGRELTVPAVRRFDRAHPRCGTSFLLTLTLVAGVAFPALLGLPLWSALASRLALAPLLAGLSYEAIRFGGAHHRAPVVRWLFSANLALQSLTTREPEDEQVQVAIAAVQRCIEADREAQSPLASG